MITITGGRGVARPLARQGVLHHARAGAASTRRSQGLKRAAGFLRSQLAQRLKLHTTPELRFEYDESVERGDRLSRLIDSAKLKPAAMTIDGALLLDKPRRASARTRALQGAKRLFERDEGRPRRHARPAGLRAADRSLRRGDQVRRPAARRRQGVPRHAAARRDDRDRRRRRRGARETGRAGLAKPDRCRGAATLHGRDRAGAADALGAEARRRAALRTARARARRSSASARRVRIDDARGHEVAQLAMSSCASRAARAPTCAPWPRTSAQRSGRGAHLAALRRTASGRFRVEDAVDAGRAVVPLPEARATAAAARGAARRSAARRARRRAGSALAQRPVP